MIRLFCAASLFALIATTGAGASEWKDNFGRDTDLSPRTNRGVQASFANGKGAATVKLVQRSLGRVQLPFSVRLQESESTLGPADPNSPARWNQNRQPQQQRAPQRPQNRMYSNGYRQFNDVRMNSQGQLRIGNEQVQARRGYNPQTGRGAWVYETERGGTVVRRDGDSRTYVRPGPGYQQNGAASASNAPPRQRSGRPGNSWGGRQPRW